MEECKEKGMRNLWRRERRDAYRILVRRPERRRLGRLWRTWEDNIKMDLQGVVWRTWTGLIWLRIGTGGGLL